MLFFQQENRENTCGREPELAELTSSLDRLAQEKVCVCVCVCV